MEDDWTNMAFIGKRNSPDGFPLASFKDTLNIRMCEGKAVSVGLVLRAPGGQPAQKWMGYW